VRESFLITVLVASSLFAGTSASERKIDNNAIISERDAKVRADKNQKEEVAAETLIRKRVDDWAKAIRAKDIDSVMSFYTPNIVSFDLDPPLRYAGTENKRRAWQEFFTVHTGPITYEVRELNVTTHGELAFLHSLNHVSGTLASGQTSDLWVRWTACFQRIDGAWLIVHDHVSVPADLKHGQAVLNLTP
jgi:uncharacterized protein (TIGR02246 family)